VAAGRALLGGRFGDAGRRLVIEERLQGTEASLFFACDGRDARLLPHARDHKRLGDDDVGPNTGGMGSISPNPMIDSRAIERVRREIVEPTLEALTGSGAPYRGFLYAGVMLTQDGPRVLEFNVRLGDPEAQAILPRLLPGGFLAICEATARGRLAQLKIDIDPRPTCAVVLAASGYPDEPRKGDLIDIEGDLSTGDRWLDHAGTRRDESGLITSGGRVAAVVARAGDAAGARQNAYEGVERVRFAGKHFRTDIGRM
jgi:phosphoribosylamine--glycine ligase